MKSIYTVLFTTVFSIIVSTAFAQEIDKENFTKIVNTYYDFNKSQPQASGHYYKDNLGETTEKHGKWKYFDRYGELEEVRNYYRDMLYGQVLLFYPNKKIRREGYFKYDRQDSIYREWNETGKPAIEGYYKMGSPVGKWQHYYINGQLKSLEIVEAGVNLMQEFYLPDSLHTQAVKDGNGTLSTFYNTGSLKEEYGYKNGLKDGKFAEYSIYGYSTLTGEFKEGEKKGEWKYSYYTGDIEKISHYKSGKLDGAYQYFYDNGQLNVAGNYAEGKKTGKWVWYTNKGKKDQEGYFIEDLQDGNWGFYYPSEQISYNAEFKKGLKHGFWSYFYKDGSKFKEGSFVDDLKDGDWKTWYENGTLLMTGKYSKGKEEGEWKNYWENGKLKNLSFFSKGLLNGAWESYHKSGIPSLKGEYKENNRSGEWTSFFDNGRPKETITYKVITTKSKMDYSILKDFERTDSERHGKYIAYSDKDFKLLETGQYNKGEKDGEWNSFHPGGKIPAVISNFKDGVLHGVQKQNTRRGDLVSELDYKNGLRDGYFRAYNKKGKVVIERRYKNGLQIIEGSSTGTSFDPK